MAASNKPEFLEKKNPHSRDADILFEEGPHTYTICGDSNYMSVTKWNHSHFWGFNAELIISNMMKGKNWENSKYYGMTKQEIKDLWRKNGRDAATAGTNMHYDIECFYNKCPRENDSVEYSYFTSFQKDHSELVPYRTEWMVYDKEHRFAGSIDMVFENSDGTLEIYDWKRCKSIDKASKYNKYAKTNVINHVPDTNYWHYSLQLNTYKAILEKNYGKTVTGLYLICLHPENECKTYIKINIPDMKTEIKDLFELRKKHLNK